MKKASFLPQIGFYLSLSLSCKDLIALGALDFCTCSTKNPTSEVRYIKNIIPALFVSLKPVVALAGCSNIADSQTQPSTLNIAKILHLDRIHTSQGRGPYTS